MKAIIVKYIKLNRAILEHILKYNYLVSTVPGLKATFLFISLVFKLSFDNKHGIVKRFDRL